MYRSVNFDSCIELCNYCHNRDLEQCHHLLKIPPASYLFAVNSPLLRQAPGNYWSPYVPLVLCLPEHWDSSCVNQWFSAFYCQAVLRHLAVSFIHPPGHLGCFHHSVFEVSDSWGWVVRGLCLLWSLGTQAPSILLLCSLLVVFICIIKNWVLGMFVPAGGN